MIYVYTSILDGWDNLRPPLAPPESGVRYLCFTNIPTLPDVYPWEFRPLYDVGEACRTARVPKILPHLLLPEDAEYSIYHDGNFQLKKTPADMIGELLGEHDWAAHRHPCRTCVYQEADVILDHSTMRGWRDKNRAKVRPIIDEVGGYRAMQYPEHNGLWANGMLVRRHSSRVAALNERWWRLYSAGGVRDQLSFPVARHLEGLSVKSIDADISISPYLNFWFHAAWKDRPGSLEYKDERTRIRSGLARLKDVTGVDGGLRYPEF